ncbi:MAG: hypothetical protein KGH64_05365 [Candidatus Micrarchaeota archaeon]|nr:hypothetical protein [Candidatus Micrarchaeota archaeon]
MPEASKSIAEHFFDEIEHNLDQARTYWGSKDARFAVHLHKAKELIEEFEKTFE